ESWCTMPPIKHLITMMKPLNIITLKSSYKNFVIHFSLLILFSIICVFFYYQTKNADFILINKRLELVNKNEEARKEVDAELQVVRAKLTSISRAPVRRVGAGHRRGRPEGRVVAAGRAVAGPGLAWAPRQVPAGGAGAVGGERGGMVAAEGGRCTRR